MTNKLKIHTFPIDHWFDSKQDIDLYRRINFHGNGATQVINTRSTTLASPGYFYDLMTEEELIEFLRISEVSAAADYSNVIKNLIRFRDLPRIKICNKLLFPRKAILDWINNQTIKK